MPYFLFVLFLSLFLSNAAESHQSIVLETKQIKLHQYPDAYNPSIIAYNEGYLMTFRYVPNPVRHPFLSYIGIVVLDKNFDPIADPQLLDSRFGSTIPSQSEDARLFQRDGKTYLIYNDCIDVAYDLKKRRDMFIAELKEQEGRFILDKPLKLIHEEKYYRQLTQKNWVPFDWNGLFFLSYTLSPHEVLFANLNTGVCSPFTITKPCLTWNLGDMRPSGTPQLVDGEYLSFFHSVTRTYSPVSDGYELYHLFCGAYTFSAEPPFELTKISPAPLVGENFYTGSREWKVVIYPGGFVVKDNTIYLAYGKNDFEIWIATIDKAMLLDSMVPLTKFADNIYDTSK